MLTKTMSWQMIAICAALLVIMVLTGYRIAQTVKYGIDYSPAQQQEGLKRFSGTEHFKYYTH